MCKKKKNETNEQTLKFNLPSNWSSLMKFDLLWSKKIKFYCSWSKIYDIGFHGQTKIYRIGSDPCL